MNRFLSLTLSLSLIVFLAGCGESATAPREPDAPADESSQDESAQTTLAQSDTPEAAFAALRTATDNQDWGSAARVLVPESQAMMAFPLMMTASFMVGPDEEDKQQSLEALLRKHGLDPEDDEPPEGVDPADPTAMMQAAVAPVKDLPGFLGELADWIKENGDDSDRGGFMEMGELSEVSIDGDSATATVSTKRGEMPIQFRRVEGTWLVHLPDEGPRGGGGRRSEREEMEPVDPNAPEFGTLSIGEDTYTLRHAIAYSSKFFDDPVTAVLLTAKPVPESDLKDLKKMLAEEGNDDGFHVWDAQLKLTFDEDGELMFANGWADNTSISASTDENVMAQIGEEGGRVTGNATMLEPRELFDSTYQFDVMFFADLIKPAAE